MNISHLTSLNYEMDSIVSIQTTDVASLTPQDVKIPDFKVSTRIFEVENDVNWGRLGDCDDYFWTTPDERGKK